VGTLNAFEMEVVDPGACLLRIDNQTVQTSQSLSGFRSGDKAMIAIRPERLSFVGEERKANVLKGGVENITFLGSIVRVLVRVGQNAFFLDTFNNPYLELPKIGEEVEITFSKDAVLVLNSSNR
jgi:putative spermidine/putrescine transport system ATP-binding protein